MRAVDSNQAHRPVAERFAVAARRLRQRAVARHLSQYLEYV